LELGIFTINQALIFLLTKLEGITNPIPPEYPSAVVLVNLRLRCPLNESVTVVNECAPP
jgi:hypothetical protein